jgi:hypothetical protein
MRGFVLRLHFANDRFLAQFCPHLPTHCRKIAVVCRQTSSKRSAHIRQTFDDGRQTSGIYPGSGRAASGTPSANIRTISGYGSLIFPSSSGQRTTNIRQTIRSQPSAEKQPACINLLPDQYQLSLMIAH